jgi:hypothetical protein
MWYGISYFQNYNSIPNPISPLFHNIISIRKAMKFSFHTDAKSSDMDTALNEHTPSIFRQPPEDGSSTVL